MDTIKTEAAPRLINAREVTRQTSLSRSTIARMVKERTFPAPIRFGHNHIAWREWEVRNWIDGLTTSRTAEPRETR